MPAKQEAEYTLSICPQFGGVFTGSLTFTAPGGLVVWYTVEVRGEHENTVVASRLTQKALQGSVRVEQGTESLSNNFPALPSKVKSIQRKRKFPVPFF